MEIRYQEQNITYHLLYCATFIFCNHGRHIYVSYAGSEICAYSVNDGIWRNNGSVDWAAPSLVEIYVSDIKKVYQANGVPLYLGLALTNISAYIHLFLMSILLYIAAPLAFHAELPAKPGVYFISLTIFIVASLSIASIIGMAVKDPAKTSMFSIIVFLPSIIFSGIMFPIELLPKAFKTTGKLFPATWGYKLMAENVFKAENLLPLLLIFVFAAIVCSILLRRIDK